MDPKDQQASTGQMVQMDTKVRLVRKAKRDWLGHKALRETREIPAQLAQPVQPDPKVILVLPV
jgi:hypothetical protein